MRRSALSVTVFLGLSAFGGIAGAQSSQQSNSWNLSRAMARNDMLVANPTTTTVIETGVWTFMQLPSSTPLPANNSGFTLLPSYTTNCLTPSVTPGWFNCWQPVSTPTSLPLIGVSVLGEVTFNNGFSLFDLVQGMTMLHPSQTQAAVIAWTSPSAQSVHILGRIADVDAACGDGVQWAVMKDLAAGAGAPVGAVLPYATVMNSASTLVAPAVSVAAGARVYFVVHPGPANAASPPNHSCDSTTLDVLITKI